MYFAKNEIIELNDNEKYLVLDTAIIDEEAYYKIKKLNTDETDVEGEERFISATNDEGKIYINEDLTPEIISKLKELLS
jgi:hypothetical protein